MKTFIVESPGFKSQFGVTYFASIPWGGHGFILARPKVDDWSEYDGSTIRAGREEFRPVMIRGVESGQRVYVHGGSYGFDVDRFEFSGPLTVYDRYERGVA